MTERSNVPRATSKSDREVLDERPHERLRRLLDRADIGNAEAAELLGVAEETVSRWRNGRQAPDDDVLEKFVAIFAERGIVVSVGWIWYGERDGNPPPYRTAPPKKGAGRKR